MPFIRGKEQLGANVEVGYYDQTQSKLTPSNTVLDELWNDFADAKEVEIATLAALPLPREMMSRSLSACYRVESGRVTSQLSMENNNFLILDEP